MQVFDAIKTRGSKRKFAPDPVPVEDVRRCVEMAGKAPSPHNDQMWRFIAIYNHDILGEMRVAVNEALDKMFSGGHIEEEAARQIRWYSTFFADAPVVIAVCMKPFESVITPQLKTLGVSREKINEMRGMPDYQSLGAAIQNYLLAATELGYGTCWLSGPMVARKEFEEILQVDSPWHVEALIAMGRPDGPMTHAPRKSVEEIFSVIE